MLFASLLAVLMVMSHSCEATGLALTKKNEFQKYSHLHGFFLLFSKFMKNLMSRAFSCQKHAKSICSSCTNKKIARIFLQRLILMSSSLSGTQLVVTFLVLHVPPFIQRLGGNTPCHSDVQPGRGNTMCSHALLWS